MSAGEPSAAPETYLVEVSRQAMACRFALLFNAGQYPDDTAVAIEALDLVERLEDVMSVYRPHSTLSQLNVQASAGPAEVEPGLFDLLTIAMAIASETAGAYDITAGPLSKAWGFFQRAGAVPSDQELDEARRRVGYQAVRLDQQARTVEFLKPGMELNVNSIGKGDALDRAAEVLARQEVNDFLFHGGQSSVLARGDHAAQAKGGWTVGLRHPLRPQERLARIVLRDQALATSGSGTQFFHSGGQRYGHLIDPRTGRPASGLYSATVVAASAAQADALSTACYVLGQQAALEYCQTRSDLAVILVAPGTRQGTVEVVQHGLDDDQWQTDF